MIEIEGLRKRFRGTAVVDGIDFELLVLPEAMLRQPPRPRAGEPAMPRATLAELQARATRD